MTIGIDASRAFLKRRTGIEEYAYQTIRHLVEVIPGSQKVILYVRKRIAWQNGRVVFVLPEIDFELPKHWEVRAIWAPRFWTQIGLSLEMLFCAPEVLFVPAHTVPLIHPKKTIVTIHGLEYEFCKESYSFWERIYMHHSIKFSCRAASTVVCVSENTKKDVMSLYDVSEEKIVVIYEGYEKPLQAETLTQLLSGPYFLFIGRLEERKNIVRIIEAFERVKEKLSLPHKLVLAGKFGYGKESIEKKILQSRYKKDILVPGYISEKEKWQYLAHADLFLFPTLYEGFGLPVLEAQSVGVPLVTSETSSLPEVAGEGALLVDPVQVESIAGAVEKLLSEAKTRDDIIRKAKANVLRFDWRKCAEQIFHICIK